LPATRVSGSERLLRHPTRLEEAGEVAAVTQLGSAQLDRAGTGLPVAIAIAVALDQPVRVRLVIGSADQRAYLKFHEPLGGECDHLAQHVRVGGFTRRAEEIVAGELAAAPEIKQIVEALLEARRSIADRIKTLDSRVRAVAKRNATARLFMTAPGVGAVIGLSVASAYDDASRFGRSSSVGAYFGLTPRRYESGEVSRNGRISKRANKLTRTHLDEAANVIPTREVAFSSRKAWGLRLAKSAGFKKAKVAVARKLAVILHAMWKTNTPFRYAAA
jgi:transposase